MELMCVFLTLLAFSNETNCSLSSTHSKVVGSFYQSEYISKPTDSTVIFKAFSQLGAMSQASYHIMVTS